MLNRLELCGRLCADPVLKQTKTGVPCTSVKLAVARPYKNSDGTRDTDFFLIDLYRHHAEYVCKFLRKGESLFVEAALEVRSYLDPVSGGRRWNNDIIVKEIRSVDSRKKAADGSFDTEEFFDAAVRRSQEIMGEGQASGSSEQ